MDDPETFNYETSIQSIRNFIANRELEEGKKFYLVMDNAPFHKKTKRLIKEKNSEFDDNNQKVVFVYLPPYSPDLNPIEQFQRKTRREVIHNRYFSSKEDLKLKLGNYFDGNREPNDDLNSLCTFNFASYK